MKNKASLALIELVIMLLIFAMAAALCLQAFLWSGQQSEAIVQKDRAVLEVQNVAELLKESRGDVAVLAASGLGFTEISLIDDGCCTITFDGEMAVMVTPADTGINGLGGAGIRASDGDGREIFSLEVRWQEPLEGGDGHA